MFNVTYLWSMFTMLLLSMMNGIKDIKEQLITSTEQIVVFDLLITVNTTNNWL
jgi:hypothetical protein